MENGEVGEDLKVRLQLSSTPRRRPASGGGTRLTCGRVATCGHLLSSPCWMPLLGDRGGSLGTLSGPRGESGLEEDCCCRFPMMQRSFTLKHVETVPSFIGMLQTLPQSQLRNLLARRLALQRRFVLFCFSELNVEKRKRSFRACQNKSTTASF